MHLVRLIYASTLSKSTTPEEVRLIHKKAIENNPKKDLTGILLFGENKFIQCLEGDRQAVNEVYTKIARDTRHENLVLVHYSEPTRREFQKWAMRLVMMTNPVLKVGTAHGMGKAFDPYVLTGRAAFDFLLDVRELGIGD